MKNLLNFAAVGLATFLTACASTPQTSALSPVGPAPFEPASHTVEGQLLVYSAIDPGLSSDQDASIHHSDYRIYLPDGKPLKRVTNWVGTFTEDPAVVGLAPGRYDIAARATGGGTIKVPVIIEAGKTTTVHLDGSKPPTGVRERPESDWVRLPNGFVIGWRGPIDSQPK